jgi:hypothetical protein
MMEFFDLLPDGRPRFEPWADSRGQLRTIRDRRSPRWPGTREGRRLAH